jgi:mRNA-degrading endonuclease RelE of RelBE toxin-antitoxin system
LARELFRQRSLIKRLEAWPEVSGVKALSGDLAGWYRLRTGDYRLRFYLKDEDTVVVDRIGHRKDIYEG